MPKQSYIFIQQISYYICLNEKIKEILIIRGNCRSIHSFLQHSCSTNEMHFYKECFIPIIFGHYECFYEALFLTKKFNKKAFVWQEFFFFFFHKSSSHNHQKNCLLSLQHISKHTLTLLDAKLILNYYIDIAPKRCITLQNVLCTCYVLPTLYSTLQRSIKKQLT